jgi:hypothetical protein
MSDNIRDANLELLIGLKTHLDQAANLRVLLDRLLSLAQAPPATQPKPNSGSERRRKAVRP